MAERPIVVTGKYRGEAKGKIKLSGKSGSEDYSAVYFTEFAKADESNAGIQYLWARNRIKLLDDYIKLAPNDVRIEAVTKLGLAYSLLTNYTSFIAIDHNTIATTEQPKKVKQALPLPQGVPNSAIGTCLLYTSPSPRDQRGSRMPSSA